MKNESPSEIGFIDTVNDHIDLLLDGRAKNVSDVFFCGMEAKLKVSK
jgi:CxxC motif-containing protein (DUF1111 family)